MKTISISLAILQAHYHCAAVLQRLRCPDFGWFCYLVMIPMVLLAEPPIYGSQLYIRGSELTNSASQSPRIAPQVQKTINSSPPLRSTAAWMAVSIMTPMVSLAVQVSSKSTASNAMRGSGGTAGCSLKNAASKRIAVQYRLRSEPATIRGHKFEAT